MGTGLGILLKDTTLYIAYAAAIIAFFFSLSGKIKYGLIFLIFLLPLQNIFEKLQQLPFGKDIPNLILLAMILGWLINSSSKNKPIFEKNPFNTLLILYCLYTYFTLWYGSLYFNFPLPLSITEPRFQTWKNYIMLPLLFFIGFNNTKNKKELVTFFIFMCLVMVLMNRNTLADIKNASSWLSRAKFHGTFEWLGANEVAAFYASYTAVLIGIFFFIKKSLWKILLGLLIVVNLYCLVFLFSRGEYLAILVALFLIGLFRYRIILILIVLTIVSWQTILPQRVVERIQFTEVEGQLDKSASKRIKYWDETMGYFAQSPIVGVGFNVKAYLGSGKDTHNLYIRTLAEQGIIGLLFLLGIWLTALKRGMQLFKRTNDKFFKGLGLGFTACVMAVMVGNFFGDRWTYLPLGAYFWVFLAMVERANLITDEELKK